MQKSRIAQPNHWRAGKSAHSVCAASRSNRFAHFKSGSSVEHSLFCRVRFCTRLLTLTSLCLLPLPSSLPALAQEAPPPAAAGFTAQDELPLILLFVPQADIRAKDDPNLLVTNALKTNITESGKFRIRTFTPDAPSVKRALADKMLRPADLAETPLSQETRRTLARVMGAQCILAVTTTKTPDGLKTSTIWERAADLQTWQTMFVTEGTASSKAGRKRFSMKDTAAIAADTITVQIGLPSRLAENLKVAVQSGNKEQGAGNKTLNAKPETPDPKTAQTASPQEGTGSREQGIEDRKPNEPMPQRSNDPTLNTKTAQPSGTVENQKSQIENPTAQRPTPKPNETFAAFTTDTAAGRTEETPVTRTLPKNDDSQLDYEAMAIRFRQSGDTANMISSLRRAINEKPKEVNLRKLLVQAYQDRRLPDAARMEAQRALIIAPEDGTLHRMYGETLLAEGNVADARKAFEAAIRLNASDISAQVALGDVLLADNQFTQAVAAYEAAAKMDARSSLPHRRLARVYVSKAASDPKQYGASLDEIGKARALIAPADTQTYEDEYLLILKILDSRLSDLLAQLQGSYTARLQNKLSAAELVRTTLDMKERTEAAADYLEKLPAAAGWNAVQARYAQSAAYLLQAMTFFRDYLTQGDTRAEDSYKEAQLEAQRELTNAQKRLNAPKKK
jgi:Tfp pilus assembly protein PilF